MSSSGSYYSRGGPMEVSTIPKVKRSTFIIFLIIMLFLVVLFLALFLIAFFLYRKTLANLENNICPVCPGQK